jgi:hypothetical protein
MRNADAGDEESKLGDERWRNEDKAMWNRVPPILARNGLVSFNVLESHYIDSTVR